MIKWSRAKRIIIREYLDITTVRRLAGSELYREIARKLDYTIDKKRKSNSFISETINSYEASQTA